MIWRVSVFGPKTLSRTMNWVEDQGLVKIDESVCVSGHRRCLLSCHQTRNGRYALGVLFQGHHEADQTGTQRHVPDPKHRRIVSRFSNGHFHASPLPLKLPHYCRTTNNTATLDLTCQGRPVFWGGRATRCIQTGSSSSQDKTRVLPNIMWCI